MTDTFHKLKLASVRRIPGDAVELIFDVPASLADQFAYQPGQHIGLRATVDGAEHERTYTICSRRGVPIRIGIKHVAGGAFSSWAQTKLKAGMRLDVAPPRGRFVLPPASTTPRHLLMLAAGAGITPILGMTIDALENEADSRVTLVYGSRTLANAMFLAELEDLKDKYPARLDLIHVLSRAGEADTDLLSGRIGGEKIKALASHCIAIGSVDRAFLCGPGDFIKNTRNALFEMGLARDRVHHEFFVGRSGGAAIASTMPIAPPISAAPAISDIKATIIIDGQRHAIPLARGQHVLDAALAAGLKPPYSCTAGMCSTCRAHVVDGSVSMTANYSLEDWELKRGFVLTCQAVATSDTLVIDYDAM